MSKKNNNKKTRLSKHNIKTLREKLQSIYTSINLETTCPGHCVCCHIACPQMNSSEFLVIAEKLYNTINKVDRIEILKKCVRYFFSTKLIKPCPLLDGKRCSVYADRPLSCRLFGQWPEDMYEERVQRFMSVTGMKREEIPLNKQCEYVRRVDTSIPLTRENVQALYDDLNNVDQVVQKYSDEQIAQRYNQRTWHDWFMVSVFGEERLADLSNFFLAAETQDVVDDFVNQMCIQIDKVGQDIFKAKK